MSLKSRIRSLEGIPPSLEAINAAFAAGETSNPRLQPFLQRYQEAMQVMRDSIPREDEIPEWMRERARERQEKQNQVNAERMKRELQAIESRQEGASRGTYVGKLPTLRRS